MFQKKQSYTGTDVSFQPPAAVGTVFMEDYFDQPVATVNLEHYAPGIYFFQDYVKKCEYCQESDQEVAEGGCCFFFGFLYIRIKLIVLLAVILNYAVLRAI